jgi:hypothetical protein
MCVQAPVSVYVLSSCTYRHYRHIVPRTTTVFLRDAPQLCVWSCKVNMEACHSQSVFDWLLLLAHHSSYDSIHNLLNDAPGNIE